MFKDSFFKKVENKTNVDKDTIINLAKKLQNSDTKDENTIRNLIKDLCKITNKEISKDKEDKIVNTILKDKVPKNIDSMF